MQTYILGTDAQLDAQLEVFTQIGRDIIKIRGDREILIEEGIEKGFRKNPKSKGTDFKDVINIDFIEGPYIHHPDNWPHWEQAYKDMLIASIDPALTVKQFKLTSPPEQEV